MIIQGESHPRLATRVYECYQWSKTDTYAGILNGTYEIVLEDKIAEEEVVAAEVSVEFDKSSKIQMSDPTALARIDVALARVNENDNKRSEKNCSRICR